jgi:EmrB/QacA subfamily drug resistance transporter
MVAAQPIESLEEPERPSPVEPPPTSANVFAARMVAIAVASALLMEFVDATALSTALPTLARAFHTDPIHLKLALTSYILALAVVAPASGWVADRYGPRRVFLIAMGVFLAASVMCGLSHSLGELVAFRIVQGLGGAMMTPVGRLIVVGASPREQLVSAMSWYTMPALIGPLTGPAIAGLILHFADWPFIFFVNVPIGILGMIAVMRFVPQLKQPDPGRFDTLGFIIVAVGLTAMVGAAETIGVSLVPGWVQITAAAVAVGSGLLFWRHSRLRQKPVLAIGLLRFATFRTSLVGGTLVRLGIGATPFLLPLLLQVGLGWTPLKAGLASAAMAVGILVFKPVAPAIIRQFGFKRVLAVTNLIVAAATMAPGFFRASTPLWLIVAVFAAGGFFRSMQFTAINTIAFADVPLTAVSRATTLSTVVQQVGLALGISFGALVLHLTRGAGGALTPDRFTLPFVLVGAITLIAGPFYQTLAADAGANVSGHRR